MPDKSEHENLVYHKIGGQIRKYRKERDMKLQDLASLTGIGLPMLSKIENGRILPTIPSLFLIIEKLEIAPEVFFRELNREDKFPGYFYMPKKEYLPYVKEENAQGFNYFSILEHTKEKGAFQVSLLKLATDASRPLITTSAFEFIFVVSGKVEYWLDEKSFLLEEGDSLFFDGMIPHVPVSKCKKEAVLLVLYFFNNEEK